MTQMDLDFVRSQFPAFSQPSLDGWAFFENAGGSYPCRQVVDRLMEFYGKYKVQPYGSYPASVTAGEMMDESYTRLAGCLNVGDDEVYFGPSTSQNSYVLANAFRQWLAPGDEIVVTNQDHEANSGAWRRLAESGVIVREWAVDPESGHLDPVDLDNLLSEKTRLVAFPHASNIVAEINPVAEICAKAHAVGAVTVVDGVSYAPHGLPDVTALGTDVYFFSAYKTYGPHQGAMVVRRALAEKLPNQSHYFNAGKFRSALTPAGPDHAQIAAMAGIANYLDAVHDHHFNDRPGQAIRAARAHDVMRTQELAVMAPVLEFLDGRNDVRLLGPRSAERRAPTFALSHREPGEALSKRLVDHKIMAGGGDFYARRVVEALGIDAEHGVLRVSFTHYTSPEEVDQLIRALDQVL